MNPELIFIPSLLHFFLVISLYGLLLIRKRRAAKGGGVDLKAAALNCKAWPDDVVLVSNNLDNQYEAPVFFHVLCLVLFAVGAVNPVSMGFAWLFFISRCVHAVVHIGSNYVPVRMKVFAVGIVALLGMATSAMCKILPLYLNSL